MAEPKVIPNVELVCFHCGDVVLRVVECKKWEVKTCYKCHEKHHKTHHKSCELENDAGGGLDGAHEGAEQVYFTIFLTRFDGVTLSLKCERGKEFQLEEHWAGTYVFGGAMVTLVKEDKKTINDRLLEGLRTLPF